MSHVLFSYGIKSSTFKAFCQYLCSIACLYEERIRMDAKFLSKTKDHKNHISLVAYECEYCDVRKLILDEMSY